MVTGGKVTIYTDIESFCTRLESYLQNPNTCQAAREPAERSLS